MEAHYSSAPELCVSEWVNTEQPITLQSLRGKVVVVEVFQMLCPGCVSHGLPQAAQVADTFPREHVVVLGLHSVFEHHAVQGTREALRAFLHEYRFRFPVAIDAPSGRGLPQTMTAYHMQGTPTMLLIDRKGRLRAQLFGQMPDMSLGAQIAQLVHEDGNTSEHSGLTRACEETSNDCNQGSCTLK